MSFYKTVVQAHWAKDIISIKEVLSILLSEDTPEVYKDVGWVQIISKGDKL